MRGGGFGVPGRNGGCVPLDAGMAAMMMAGQCTPHFLFDLAEKKTGRARSKRKERFGGSGRIYASLLPPAGEGWHSLAEVRDGNARPLGKPPVRGSQGYPQPPSPLPLTLLRRTASGSEKRSSSMRQPPRRGRHHPPRDGSTYLVEESGVPEGGPKSEQAPIRRPPCARRATAPECAQAAFSFGPCTARFLFRKTEKKMGGASPLDKPPCGSRIPRGRCSAARITPGGMPQKQGPLPFIFPQTRTRTPSR